MSNTQKEARRDAREYARAQMYYGEGAGNRRKLIFSTVDAKAERDPAYARAFHQELARQDMAEHATKARRERERRDRTEMVTKNTKHLLTGNYQNVQSSVLVLVVAGYFAHQTGLDKKVYEKGKKVYRDIRIRLESRKIRKNRKVHNITVVK